MAALFSISLGKNFPGLTVRIHRKTKELTPPRPSAVFLFHPRLAFKNNPPEPGSSKEQTNDAPIISRGNTDFNSFISRFEKFGQSSYSSSRSPAPIRPPGLLCRLAIEC